MKFTEWARKTLFHIPLEKSAQTIFIPSSSPEHWAKRRWLRAGSIKESLKVVPAAITSFPESSCPFPKLMDSHGAESRAGAIPFLSCRRTGAISWEFCALAPKKSRRCRPKPPTSIFLLKSSNCLMAVEELPGKYVQANSPMLKKQPSVSRLTWFVSEDGQQLTQILDFEEIKTTSAHPGKKEYKELIFSTQPFPNNNPKNAVYKYPSVGQCTPK